jgi:hypothetical protein
LHRAPDETEHAAAIVRDQVHPVLDRPPERGHGPLHTQQQHLRDEGDEDGPPPPVLGDLGSDGAVDGVVIGDVAGAQKVEQAADATLVRAQHHEVAKGLISHVHDRRESNKNDGVARAGEEQTEEGRNYKWTKVGCLGYQGCIYRHNLFFFRKFIGITC